jgi:hypothetical protein
MSQETDKKCKKLVTAIILFATVVAIYITVILKVW